MPALLRLTVLALAALIFTSGASTRVDAEPKHGLAMHGELKQSADFTHYDYVNPNAPKGGTLKLGVRGTFDSLNPFIVKGAVAPSVRTYVYESLLSRAGDESFTMYGLLAEKVETPDDRSWVAFTLNPKARFSDGKPVTAEDVIYSHRLLREKGRPNHRTFYSKVEKVEVSGDRTVKFTFKPGTDREMPLIMGYMPVLPKHALSEDAFQKTTLAAPIGSGPYRIGEIKPGRSIEYVRNPDYWGKDLPVRKGQFNFDTVRIELFRDVNSMREAFSKGVSDVRGEGDPAQWATSFDFPAVASGKVIKRTFPLKVSSGMSALAFNTRRDVFKDKRVRSALINIFDFEWLNQTLYHGLYERTQSFFDRSALSSHGQPASELEKQLLGEHAKAIPLAIMDGTHTFPKSDGRGRNRKNIRAALKLLKSAGYALKDGKMIKTKTGEALAFEILIVSQPQQKMLNGFTNTLRQVGIDVTVRQVDSSEYTRRRQNFDFDMTPFRWGGTNSPGNEQTYRWGSKAADAPGSFNVVGVKSPAVDAMIEALLAARDRQTFEAAVRAYDRTLLSGDYMIPLYHLPEQWVAHWSHLAFPNKTSFGGYQLDTWWDTRVAN